MVFIFLWLIPYNTNKTLAYDDKTTHRDLTREVIAFYELSTGKKFTDEQKQWIISGSVEEDRAPRWINHFYDPVFERGLQAESIGISGYLAKNWAQYSSYQSINPENIANLWTGKGPVISGSWWGDFSYEAAIKDYSKNKEKESYLALGHVLHLIEDMTVPEHTRNDPHPGGKNPSYYENWTSKNFSGLTQDLGKRIFNQGRKPIIYTELESYFNNLATYTNNHFFSPRTINSGLYQKPKIVFEDGIFAYGRDENGELFDLAYIDADAESGNKVYKLKDEHYQVMQEYWIRLSRQAVINGAGVIQLFLNQATAARDAELAKQKMETQQTAKKSSFISQIINFFSSPEAPKSEPALVIKSEPAPAAPKIIKSIPNTQSVAQAPVPAPKPVTAPIVTPAPTPAPQNQSPQSNPPMVYGSGGGGGGGSTPSASSGQVALNTSGGGSVSSSNSNSSQNTQTTTQTQTQATSTSESLNVSTFNAGDLVINEIMYDLEGSDTSSGKSREWVEIYNNSGHTITLTGGNGGWRFNDGSNHLLNEPAAQGSMTISAGGYAILAGDAAIFLIDHPGFSGTVIDTVMSLKNTSAILKISSPDGTLIDEVTYNSSWGANGNGKTLERKSAAGGSNDPNNWGVSSVNGGTPDAANNWELLMSDINSSASTTPPVLGLGTDVPATTTISGNVTWTLAGSPYRLFFDGQRRPTVAAGAILTIVPGVKIIPQGGNYTAMEIQGTFNAIATSGAPIIFTSINDADNNASTTPQKGDWLNIVFSQGAQVNMDYVEFRYGGQGIALPLREMVDARGATVNIKNSKFANSQNTALHLVDSSGIVENSIFSDNNCGISIDSSNGIANTSYAGCYGVHTSGQILSVASQIKNNQFIRNQLIGVEVRSGTAPTINSNTFTDNGYPIKIESSYPTMTNSQIANSTTSPKILNGIAISGYTHFSQNYTLKKDLPYILETNGPALSPYVDAGVTLTIEPGVIFKTGHTYAAINVNGNLMVLAVPDNPIVFTSLKDDATGGDTNGDGAASLAQNTDWANIKFLTGSMGSFVNAIFNYGGYGFIPPTLLPPVLLQDFSAIGFSWDNSEKISSSWTADKNGSFEKVVFHNFSMSNPNGLSCLIGIKRESDNNFIVSTTTANLKDITTPSDISISLSGDFIIGEKYYAVFQVIPSVGTTTSIFDLFGVGKDSNQNAAVAFYESAIQLYYNPALSIDAGATVVVQ